MGWSHPDISFEDVLNLIKGFVDIIILSSGYQSSGHLATWDSSNIKKAIQWGLFFENVLSRLRSSDDYQGSVEELDAALLEMKSVPSFPQGLADLSSATLAKARDYVVRHIIHTLPLRDAHLNSLLAAIVEMDLDDLRSTEYDCLNVYLEKLMLQCTYTVLQSPPAVPDIKMKVHASVCHSELVIQEILERQVGLSRVSSVESCLDILAEVVTNTCKGISRDTVSSLSEEQVVEFSAWNQWRSRNLLYLLNKRTLRLVSGAKLIFSAPKVQWLQVFERLKVSNEAHEDLEMIEIFLIGSVSSRWNRLIEHFLSVSHCFLPISAQYQEVQKLPHGRPQLLHSEQGHGIVGYLIALLSNQLNQLWKISPILAAIAIPLWCPLFRLYLLEIETQFKGDSSAIRCCSCIKDGKKHIDCELAERIWCLYAIHIQGANLMENTISPCEDGLAESMPLHSRD